MKKLLIHHLQRPKMPKTLRLATVTLALAIFWGILANFQFINLQSQPATALEIDSLPPLKTHPLPPSLTRWEDATESGDYFEEVETSEVGYLIWSDFPIAVYIELADNSDRSREWVATVAGAVKEWGAYLPIEIVEAESQADIIIINKQPPISLDNMRARSAETRYELYFKQEDNREILSHYFVIWLSPMQRGKYLPAAARHEFGHALGIWGHSPVETDVMYYSQVREPPPISSRDVNTLKRIYQQPTRLGN